jgi:hypothetical protein
MAAYTLAILGSNGHRHDGLVEFADDQAVIDASREALTPEHASIAIARGRGDDLEFIGVWRRGEDGRPRWTPEE